MDKAEYVLIGVVLGVFLNAIKEWWFLKGKNKKELEYLAIRICCYLDAFVYECAGIVADDGLCNGNLDQEGLRSIQTVTPNFNPLTIEVEWKTLPAKLMYEVLSFPSLIEASNRKISWTFECAPPPSYEEGFEERQLQYAKLGLKAFGLSSEIRRIGGLPPLSIPATDDWNPIQFMNQKISEIANSQEKRSKSSRRFIRNIEEGA